VISLSETPVKTSSPVPHAECRAIVMDPFTDIPATIAGVIRSGRYRPTPFDRGRKRWQVSKVEKNYRTGNTNFRLCQSSGRTNVGKLCSSYFSLRTSANTKIHVLAVPRSSVSFRNRRLGSRCGIAGKISSGCPSMKSLPHPEMESPPDANN